MNYHIMCHNCYQHTTKHPQKGWPTKGRYLEKSHKGPWKDPPPQKSAPKKEKETDKNGRKTNKKQTILIDEYLHLSIHGSPLWQQRSVSFRACFQSVRCLYVRERALVRFVLSSTVVLIVLLCFSSRELLLLFLHCRFLLPCPASSHNFLQF